MWQMALGWHAIEFAQKSAILEFYIWFRFRPLSPQWTCHSAPVCKFLSKSAHPRQKKNYVMSIFKMADLSHILDFRGPIMGSLKSPCTTYRSSIDAIALNCLGFEKITFFAFWRQTARQTDRQTDRRTDEQHRYTKPLSLSRGAAK